jgi:hypothetical protein
VALLILPGITWLIAPRAGGFAPPPAPPALARVEPTERPASPVRPTPTEPPPVRQMRSAADDQPSDAPVIGVVLDPEGKPVSEAFVGCGDRDKELVATTDNEGRFKLAAEAAGCTAISHHAGFSPSDRVQLIAGRDNVIRLNRGGAIAGEAVDERGSPVPSYLLGIESFVAAPVRGASPETVPPSPQARSIQDARGAFVLENLMPGKYMLTASAEGRPPTRTSVIEVEAGRTTHHVHIVLSRGVTLSGKVSDAETHKPLAGATVALDAVTSTTANMIASSRTDDSGVYSIEGAPAGPFSIRVAQEGYRLKIVPGIVARGVTATQDVALQPVRDGGPGGLELVGIGAVLMPQPQGVGISFIVPSSPADKVGLLNGDVITRIDGLDAQGLSVADCVQRLRGPEGSRVRVSVKRNGQTIDATITRELIVRP